MVMGRRTFRRRPPFLPYRKLFLIATEGAKTEPIILGYSIAHKPQFMSSFFPQENTTAPLPRS
jgi:hypothetical protein